MSIQSSSAVDYDRLNGYCWLFSVLSLRHDNLKFCSYNNYNSHKCQKLKYIPNTEFVIFYQKHKKGIGIILGRTIGHI